MTGREVALFRDLLGTVDQKDNDRWSTLVVVQDNGDGTVQVISDDPEVITPWPLPYVPGLPMFAGDRVLAMMIDGRFQVALNLSRATGGSGGVASVNGKTGSVTIEAPAGSGLTVDPSAGNIRLYSRLPPFKELQALSGVRNFGPATHGLGSNYEGVALFLADVVYFVPIYFEAAETITNVSMNVQVAGAGGAVIRAGVFTGNAASGAAEGGSTLQTRVVDWGTVAADTTGTKNWSSLSQGVVRGWTWFAFVCSDATVQVHTMSSPFGFDGPSVNGRPSNCHFKFGHGAGAAAFGATETPTGSSDIHPAFTFRLA